MKITAISTQVRNVDRVNVSVDGSYRFSLTVTQLVDAGLNVGDEVSEGQLEYLESESAFGKIYQRSLEYVLMRPRSVRELSDYLYRKTQPRRTRNRRTGEITQREGVHQSVASRVSRDLQERGYVSDEKFADFWVRHRFMNKGISQRKLRAELQAKGVPGSIIDEALHSSERNEDDELRKVIMKKRRRYTDDTKFMQYLARQGFSYDAIKQALQCDD